jgi:hypothetical protein
LGGGAGAHSEKPGGTTVPGSSIGLGLRFGPANDITVNVILQR